MSTPWGDRPFYGESVFQTPPTPQQPSQPLPNMSPVYVSGPGTSGTVSTGGSFTGVTEVPHEGLKVFDCGHRIG